MFRSFLIASAFIAATVVSSVALSVEGEHGPSQLTRSPISSEEAKALLRSEPATLFSTRDKSLTRESLSEIAQEAKKAHKDAKAEISIGTKDKTFDVVIQLGHYARTSGATGGQGKYVSEQEIVALIGSLTVAKLKELSTSIGGNPGSTKKIDAIMIAADGYQNPLKARTFLSLHTDAASKPCSVEPSVGYPLNDGPKGMYLVAASLAITLGLDAEKFMKDNYTANLSKYYAYNTIQAGLFEGVLEMSELTCSEQEETLLREAKNLSRNLAIAIQFALRQK